MISAGRTVPCSKLTYKLSWTLSLSDALGSEESRLVESLAWMLDLMKNDQSTVQRNEL